MVVPKSALGAWQLQHVEEQDDEPTLPLQDASDALNLAKLAINQLAVVGAAQQDATAAWVVPVAIKADDGDAGVLSGRRYSLRFAPKGRAELASEWSLATAALPPHPSILRPLAFYEQAVSAEIVSALRTAGASVSTSTPLDAVLTHPHVSLASTAPPRPLPFPLAFSHTFDLTRAAAHLIDHGVVHGDIRPAHLSLSSTASASGGAVQGPGRLLLGGLGRGFTIDRRTGYARKVDAAGLAAAAAAVQPVAAGYVAPELTMLLKAAPSPSPSSTSYYLPYGKSDTWSTGVTAYEMCIGSHPFPGYPLAGHYQVGSDGVLGRLAAPLSFPADYPVAFCDVISWMARPDPAQRITARAAARRLLSLGTGRPVPGLPPFVSRCTAPTGAVSALSGLVSGNGSSSSNSSNLASSSSSSGVRSGEGKDSDGDSEEKKEDGGTGGTGAAAAADGGDAECRYVYVMEGQATARQANNDSLTPVALIPYSRSDIDTAAVVVARACEVLDLPGNHAAADLSLVCRGGRLDPLAPVHRLPTSARSGTLQVQPGLSASMPEVIVHGFGVAAPPPPALAPPSIRTAMHRAGAASGDVGQSAGAAAAAAAGGVGQVVPVPAPSAAQASLPPPPSTLPPGAAGGAGGGAAAVGAVAAASVTTDRVLHYSFNPSECHSSITMSESNTVANSKGTWGSVLMNQGKITVGGRYTFSVQVLALDNGAGVAIGFADPERFNAKSHVFASQRGSWAYSRTGKISNGSEERWVEYGEPYGVGDIITCEVVLAKEPQSNRMRFWKNGIPQGTAFKGAELSTVAVNKIGTTDELKQISLIPAVCLGSNTGFRLARVQLKNPEVREFDRDKAHHRIAFSEDCATVWNGGKWATALAAHPGVRTGKLIWSVRLDDTKHGAGVAVGVVDVEHFHWDKQNLGASPHSWCYSKTGKKGDGSGFSEYGKSFSNGDTIAMTLDMDACTLSFSVNGDDQGIAYTAANGLDVGTLVPAVCLGSTEGNKMAKVSIIGPYSALRRFNRFACNRKVQLVDLYSAAECSDKWGTVFCDHPGIRSGRYSFGILVASAGQGCGAGVGFADMDNFNPEGRNLGAAVGSWCYSKTGKYSAGMPGVGFETYGSQYKTGDVITAEVDMEAEAVRFFLNGKDQGTKAAPGIKNMTLMPAVVLGSSDGGHYTKLCITLPAVTRFDPRRMNRHMQLKEEDKMAFTEGRWCSVLADHAGVSAGVLRFAVKLEGDGGAAIGFAEANSFKQYAQNLGASPGTWAISKTGKVSCGDTEGFHPFSEKFGAGDVIGAEAEITATEGIIRFWKNGNLLGTAFQGLAQKKLCLVPAVCLGSNTGGKASSALLVEFDLGWLR